MHTYVKDIPCGLIILPNLYRGVKIHTHTHTHIYIYIYIYIYIASHTKNKETDTLIGDYFWTPFFQDSTIRLYQQYFVGFIQTLPTHFSHH